MAPIAEVALKRDYAAKNILSKASEPVNVFDLPQLYTKPPFIKLLSALESLATEPQSWDVDDATNTPSEDRQAIASYLTKIISSPLSWLEPEDQEKVWEVAGARLSERSGRTGMPAITRNFKIKSVHDKGGDLEICLHEPTLTGDDLGLKTWGSAYMMSQKLQAIASSHFSHLSAPHMLELGSGTGLVGLTAAVVWQTDVTLTDLPQIVPNLEKNVESNRWLVEKRGGSVGAEELDWDQEFLCGQGEYDVVLAVDPLYSTAHPALLANAIEGSLKDDSPGARALVAYPLRDEATKKMGVELLERMKGYGFEEVARGDEYGFDDWEVNGERVKVQTRWVIWKRGDLEEVRGAAVEEKETPDQAEIQNEIMELLKNEAEKNKKMAVDLEETRELSVDELLAMSGFSIAE